MKPTQEQPDIPNNLPIANLKQDELMYPAPPQEPVAWYYAGSDIEPRSVALDADLDDTQKANCIPLYTAPPQRKWVGLTDEELRDAYCEVSGKEWCLGGISNAETFYDSIEAKLKEKNG